MKSTLLVLCTLVYCSISASNVQITNVQWDGVVAVTFDISWDNSWRGAGANPQFHDAVWVFVKVATNGGPAWNHVTLDVTDEGTLDVVTPGDQIGAFVRRASQGTGSVSSTLTFDMAGTSFGLFPDIKVFGVEMVYIPIGPYYVGDGLSTLRYHKGDDDTQPYLVTDSGIMTYGTGANDIFTSSSILNGNVPATYPNGYNAFYCMKYEVSQSQYVEFLNCLTFPQQQSRTETDISGSFTSTYVMSNTVAVTGRNGVRCIPPVGGEPHFFFCDLDQDAIPNETVDGQNLAMNYMSYDDLTAYLDWSGLRPMSALEYEKICRGPALPVPGEYAWGTTGFTLPGSIVDPGEASETFDNIGTSGLVGHPANGELGRCGFAGTGTSDRLTAAASFYGVMEMSANVAERIGTHSLVETTYGDGTLDIFGFNDVFPNSFSSKGRNGFTPDAVSLNGTNASVGTARQNDTGGRGVR